MGGNLFGGQPISGALSGAPIQQGAPLQGFPSVSSLFPASSGGLSSIESNMAQQIVGGQPTSMDPQLAGQPTPLSGMPSMLPIAGGVGGNIMNTKPEVYRRDITGSQPMFGVPNAPSGYENRAGYTGGNNHMRANSPFAMGLVSDPAFGTQTRKSFRGL